MRKGSTIVYESTVFPGVTEDICLPILEKSSGLKCGIDFKIGYSPERINPGDKLHTVDKIVKIVAGIDKNSLELISYVYGEIISAGTYKAPSIKIAEAAKVIENTQRDINIAFMNELAIIFNNLGLDTYEILKAASTKWNFLKFSPGLVGGHCIGVDPYYLTYKAQEVGYNPEVILAGRKINDGMGRYIGKRVLAKLKEKKSKLELCNVLIMGVTFKENVPDVRNSKVFDIYKFLTSKGISVYLTDPVARSEEIKKEYGVDINNLNSNVKIDAVILAVPHEKYLKLGIKKIKKSFNLSKRIPFFDVKGVFPKEDVVLCGFKYGSL